MYFSVGSGNTIRLTHEGVLVPPIWLGLVAVKPLIIDWCERGVTIRRGHDRFGENPMRLVARAAKVRVPIVIGRTNSANEGVVSVSGGMVVFVLVHRTPNRIKDVLMLRRLQWSKVGPNWATLSPRYWFVVFGAPLGRGR